MSEVSIARGTFKEALPLKDGAFFFDKITNILYIKKNSTWVKIYSDSPLFKQLTLQDGLEQADLKADGLTILQNKNGSWTTVGQVECVNGNFIISNEKVSDFQSARIPDGSIVYHFLTDTSDSTGSNTKNLEIEGSLLNEPSPIGDAYLGGSASIPSASATEEIAFYTKEDSINLKGVQLNLDGSSNVALTADFYNSAASTEWGLTETQISDSLFKEI